MQLPVTCRGSRTQSWIQTKTLSACITVVHLWWCTTDSALTVNHKDKHERFPLLQSLQIWPSSLTFGQAWECCFIRMYHCTCMVIPIISCYTVHVPVDLFPLMWNMYHAYFLMHGCFFVHTYVMCLLFRLAAFSILFQVSDKSLLWSHLCEKNPT